MLHFVTRKKMRDKYYLKLTGFGLLHLMTDFLCHFFAFGYVRNEAGAEVFTIFLAYNFVAFALQCPIGFFFDRIDRKISKEAGIVTGCLMILFGYGIRMNLGTAVAGLILCAIGNACLHVAGSQGVMRKGKKGLSGGGVFIAFGALGVGLGDYFGIKGNCTALPIVCLAIFAAITLFFAVKLVKKIRTEEIRSTEIKYRLTGRPLVCLCMCLFVVYVRSYVGFILPKGFNVLISEETSEAGGFMASIFPSIVSFIGKATGGIFVSLIAILVKGKGLRKINYAYGITALMLSTLLLGAFGDVPACSLIGTVLYHSLMPVTFYEIFCLIPESPGFSLGLTTLMLFAGMLPALAFTPSAEMGLVLMAANNVAGAVGLSVAFKLYLREQKENEGIVCRNTPSR